MGMVWENLTEEELCDLMCGKPEEEIYEDEQVSNTRQSKKNMVCE